MSRGRRVRELYDAAHSLAPEARAEYLGEACDGDARLRAEVEDLLRRDVDTAELPIPPVLDPGAGDAPASGPAAGRAGVPPEIVGFRIVGEIGAGGMGVVWEAEQENPRRRVALKVIRSDRHADELHARMFQREIDSLARLVHPGIATIYESGQTTDGQLFYAMELVQGERLDTRLARAFETRPPARAALRGNLALIRRVCQAVHHAHQHGVIHRDLKPSNILVLESDSTATGSASSAASGTFVGVPDIRILDFGLARVTDPDAERSFVTEAGSIRGTLQYMSPEQAEGSPDLDLRTDVYSLGVILHQAITGNLPYELAGLPLMEAVRAIREQAPDLRGLDPDLASILAMALAKDPRERYQSAFDLGEDLGRFLASLPVLARAPSTMYQLRKLVARNRVPAAFAAALLVSILGFAVWMSVLYARAVEAERATAREAESARRVSDFLVELFEEPNPTQAGGEERTVRALLDAGASRIEHELTGEPETQAALLATMGSSYSGLGAYDEADRLLARALGIHEGLPGDHDLDVADTLERIVRLRIHQGEYDEAELLALRVIGMLEETPGADPAKLSYAYNQLADVMWNDGRYDEADSVVALGLSRLEAEEDPNPEALATALNTMGNVHLAFGRNEEAEAVLLRAIEVREGAFGPGHPSLGIAVNNLAEAYRHQDRFDEAEAAYKRALAIWGKSFETEHPTPALAYNNLGLLYSGVERYEEAAASLERAVEIRRITLPPEHPLLAWTLDNLAVVYISDGRLDEAEVLLNEALGIADASVGPDHIDYAILRNNLARLRAAQGRYDEAIELRRASLLVYEETLGPDHRRVGFRCRDLADLYEEAGRPELAVPYRERAEAIAAAQESH